MKIKPILSVVCASALALSLAACGSGSSSDDSSTSIVTGQITELSGTSVTLQLGELKQGEQPSDGNAPSDKDSKASDENQTPPEKPDGDNSTPPEGDNSTSPKGNDSTPPEGNDPSEDQKPDSRPDGQPGGSTFTAGDETLTIDLSGVTLSKNGDELTTDSLAVGDLLTVTLDKDNNPLYAEVVTNQGGPGGGSGEVDQGDSANTIDSDTEEDGATYTSTGDNSGGIQTTGGGTTDATNLTVDTSGNSAAIRSDRGGRTVNVDSGSGSENVHAVMLYQSMSGDAEEGTASLRMTGSSLTGKAGDLFYITNTKCTITLADGTVLSGNA